MTDDRVRRGIAAALVAAVLLSVVGYLLTRSSAIGTLRAMQPAALLYAATNQPATVVPIRALSDVTIRRAIAARPLNPAIVNVAMVRDVALRGDDAVDRWIPTLARLGWRSTAALQNRLYVAAVRSDLRQVLDICDALMRRRQIQDTLIPLLNMVELDPALRGDFVRRLADTPVWRPVYFYASSGLKTPEQLRARYSVLQLLRRRGVPVDATLVRASVQAMIDGGMPALGFALWRQVEPGATTPLNDTRFVRASGGTSDDNPFGWQTASGDGFDADIYREGAGGLLAIQWNGRGVPVFARQRTSAPAGRYALDLAVSPEKVSDLDAFGFRLSCGATSVALQRDPRRPTRFVTAMATPCDFPTLEISGDIDAQNTPRRVDFRGITLTRLGSGAASG